MKLLGFDINRISTRVVEATSSLVKGWADLSTSWYKPNWWQLGQGKPDADAAMRSTAVFTCVSILAQEIARLRIVHFTNPDLKGQVEMFKSGYAKLMAKPNGYQTRSDFFLALMYSLLMKGNAYCLATRDSRNRIVNLTPLNPSAVHPYVVPGTGEIYYQLSQVDIEPLVDFDPTKFIPQRNMLHIRLFTPVHPLTGVSPLIACMVSVAQGMSIQSESTRFFENQSKQSGILSTPKNLGDAAAKRLRDAWATGTNGINTGKVPVLDNDLKFYPMSLSAAEAQLMEQYSMTKVDIANSFRIPLYMLGVGENPYKTAEAGQRDFVTRTLGFYIEHVEAAMESFFGFDGRTESIEFDVEGGIMRPEYMARIEGLVKGIQGGLFTPNEGRKSEGKPAEEGGDKLYMQRQMVPLDMLGLDVLAMVAGEEESTSEPKDDEEPDDDEKSISHLDGMKLRTLFGLEAA